ncbi:unnamed protein product [Trichobilharzia szidati]|nr:unnamed protein product [Trichobilharzia szidati]
MLEPFKADISHRPRQSLHSVLCRTKEPTTEKEDKVINIYKINCIKYDQHYVSRSGHPLQLRIQDDKLAEERHGMYSLRSMLMSNYAHQFDWENVETLNRGNTKNAVREFLEVWYSNESGIETTHYYASNLLTVKRLIIM